MGFSAESASTTPATGFSRLKDPCPTLAQSSRFDWSYQFYLDSIGIFKEHCVMVSASGKGMIIFVQNPGSSRSQFFRNHVDFLSGSCMEGEMVQASGRAVMRCLQILPASLHEHNVHRPELPTDSPLPFLVFPVSQSPQKPAQNFRDLPRLDTLTSP